MICVAKHCGLLLKYGWSARLELLRTSMHDYTYILIHVNHQQTHCGYYLSSIYMRLLE
jgi:hypothetical protein